MKEMHLPSLLVAGLALPAVTATAGDMPQRVVSINVCTDQLAMLVAWPGQLKSVSFLARDVDSSALARQAMAYPVNHGQAEEVFLMKPDLVLAGTYSTRATVSLLRRLGFRVEEFQTESSFAEVRSNLLRMGNLLGNPERAEALVAGMDGELAALAGAGTPRLSTALYFANGYTSASGTLIADVVRHAGLDNIAEALGLTGTARLPLELLVLASPQLLASGRSHTGAPALADQNFAHPAYRTLGAAAAEVALDNGLTACGGPFSVREVGNLQAAARDRVEDATNVAGQARP